MKKNLFKKLLCLSLSVCFLFSFACTNEGNNGGGDAPSYQLTLDTTKVILNKGDTVTLTASKGANTYFWHAEDPSLVRVVSNGNTCEITSRGDGVTKVIVKADGQEVECIVHASIDNFDRITSMLYYCETNLNTSLNMANVSNYKSGIRTYMAFEEDSVVIAKITLMPKDSFTAGTLNAIDITVSFNIYSSVSIAKQILNSSNIYITYYYPASTSGYVASGSYKLSNLVYTIDNQNNVKITDGTMSSTTNLNSIGSYYKGLILNGTIDLLNNGMTEFIKAINEKCHIDICR